MTLFRPLLAAILLLVVAACHHAPTDARLRSVAAEFDSIKGHSRLLFSINPDSLSTADRHYYDYLTLRMRKDANPYDTDGSPRFWDPDSIVPDMLQWYGSRDKAIYLQIHYMAGELYAHAGDIPTALDYFRAALDLLPHTPETRSLRASILTQMSRMLNSMSLQSEARDYLLQAAQINRELADTAALVNNLLSLGGTYLREQNFDFAGELFTEACALSAPMPEADRAKVRMYLAAALAGSGNIDSALTCIRTTPDKVFSALSPTALGYAADIYIKAGKPDSAYIFARRLADYVNPAYRAEGYRLLLSPELRRFNPADSLAGYFSDYHRLLESLYNEHDVQLAISRQAFYDYRLHERRRKEAESANDTLRIYILGSLLIIVVLIAVVLYIKNRSQNHIIALHEALEKVKQLRDLLEASPAAEADNPAQSIPSDDKEAQLFNQLMSEVKAINGSDPDNFSVETSILQSDIYRQLRALIDAEAMMPDHLWSELEHAVNNCYPTYPNFTDRLTILTSGTLTTSEFQTALLVRCGIKPARIAVLLGRSSGAIGSRRDSIGIKILGYKPGVRIVDAIIHSL